MPTFGSTSFPSLLLFANQILRGGRVFSIHWGGLEEVNYNLRTRNFQKIGLGLTNCISGIWGHGHSCGVFIAKKLLK